MEAVPPRLFFFEAVGSVSSLDGLIHFHFDTGAEEFYIDAWPDYQPRAMRDFLNLLRLYGLELIPEDECEPEMTDEGAVRIYLVPPDDFAQSAPSPTTGIVLPFPGASIDTTTTLTLKEALA